MKIKINNLKVKTVLGIYEEEQTIKRDVIINAVIDFDEKRVVKSNDIKDTIDYHALSLKIRNYCESKSFWLIETMADEVMDLIMDDKDILETELEITKPHAVDFVDSFSICLSRKK